MWLLMNYNVLVFPAGEVNSVELHDSLAYNVNIKLFGASSIDRHGGYIFENYYSGLPLISDDDFIEKFNEYLKQHDIDFIFPTHDSVATYLSNHSKELFSKVITADERTCAICRDKKKTYDLFSDCDFVPTIYKKIEKYPIFIKPREGQGSVGALLIRSKDEIPNIDFSSYVISEYLPGEEYTVDCLTDNHGRLSVISPRSRNRMMAGISVAGKNEKLTKEIIDIANTINERLSFIGLWWFQIKKDSRDKWKLLEISTRCAGTMGLTRSLGVNLPLLSVYVAAGQDINTIINDYSVKLDSTLIRRYSLGISYEYVYIDYDDTIIVRNLVNLKIIWLLYQFRNNGKKVILITKHDGDLEEDMEKKCISKRLFNSIYLVKQGEEKYEYVKKENAIFIDNSYSEREKVYNNCKIPVFDVDGADFLMDWKF